MKFVHVFDLKDPKGGITIAYEIEDVSEKKVISLGASYCSKEEPYNKAIGRQISRSRLKSQPLLIKADGSDQVKVSTMLAMFYSLLINEQGEWEEIHAFRPSRFPRGYNKSIIGPDGKVLSVSIDGGEHSFIKLREWSKSKTRGVRGWLSSSPGWATGFLARHL